MESRLGDDNWKELAHEYCSMPDVQGRSFNDFYYVNDYLLIRQCPQQCVQYLRHDVPEVQQTFVPYFRRALQALRTETPVNACRQIGPILHYVEDAGTRLIRVYKLHTTMSWNAGFARTGS